MKTHLSDIRKLTARRKRLVAEVAKTDLRINQLKARDEVRAREARRKGGE